MPQPTDPHHRPVPTSGQPAAPGTSQPTTTHRPLDVEAAYLAIIDRHLRLLADPDPSADSIISDFTGLERAKVFGTVGRLHDAGHAHDPAGGTPAVPQVTLLTVEGDRAQVESIVLDDALVVDRATGAVLEQRSEGALVLTTLAFDGRWRIEDRFPLRTWDELSTVR